MDSSGVQPFFGTYRHYKLQPDGSPRYVGTVAYRHDVPSAPDFDTVLRAYLGLDARATRREVAEELAARHADAARFEALADLACETEG